MRWPLALSTQYAVCIPVLFYCALFTEKGKTLIEYFMRDPLGLVALVLFIVMLIVFIPLTFMFTDFFFIAPVSQVHKKVIKKITGEDIEAEDVEGLARKWFIRLFGEIE